ncbi:cytochrome P450 [Saccharopolyspora sp. ID03-671]|uniref:cytochrome P450 family protein n=1 Tax=Saccharopolyspora sp. ID03-671 TaxID=3073066 RepID=UPI00324F5C44
MGRDLAGESRRLRAAGPAAPIELPGGIPAWGIVDPDLLRKLLVSPDVSKNPRLHWPAWFEGRIPGDWLLAPWLSMENMLSAYGSEHRRLRTLLSKAFTPRRIAELGPSVQHTTDELLNALPSAAEDGVVDVREHFAHLLPFDTIGRLFGLPTSMHDELRACIDIVLAPVLGADVAMASERTREILHELLIAKRETAGDDLTSALLAARDGDNPPLSETELLHTLQLVIAAGFETTVNVIDQGLTALLTHPKQLELVRTGQASWEDVVEETLRWQPSVPHMPLRFAVTNIPVSATTTIAAGDAIMACFGAANRDPDVHGDDADEFDITRPSRRQHFAFGHGAHACIGSALARMQATTALRTFFERYPGAQLAVPTEELEPISLVANGHQHLPIRL